VSHFLYHYHAVFESEPGVLEHRDGTVEATVAIGTSLQFRQLREGLAAELGIAPGTEMTVRSFTLLNPH